MVDVGATKMAVAVGRVETVTAVQQTPVVEADEIAGGKGVADLEERVVGQRREQPHGFIGSRNIDVWHCGKGANGIEGSQRYRLLVAAEIDDRAGPTMVARRGPIEEGPSQCRERIELCRVIVAQLIYDGVAVSHPGPTPIDTVFDAVEKLEPRRCLASWEIGVLPEV